MGGLAPHGGTPAHRGIAMTEKTLYDKLWDRHVVDTLPGGEALLYIDRHLIHEVS